MLRTRSDMTHTAHAYVANVNILELHCASLISSREAALLLVRPEVAILGADQKERGLWRRGCLVLVLMHVLISQLRTRL